MIEKYLQNVTIRKYGTAFLEAFGMLPLTYFGCVGDNSTDNYANLQVAIDESIKRGLRFIFVPAGTYYYTGNLLNLDKVIFIGNAKYAQIYGGENGEIKIYQIGTYVAPEYLNQGLVYKEGQDAINLSVTQQGNIEIPTNVDNGLEALVVLKETIFKVEGGLTTRDGKLFGGVPMSNPNPMEPNYFYLGENVYLTKIEIIKNAIRLHYELEDSTLGGTIDTQMYWRVR